MKTSTHKQAGFGLIEVLVAILIFSLGMVGVALYTANGLKSSANNHARATVLRTVSLAMEPIINQANSADALAQALFAFHTAPSPTPGDVAGGLTGIVAGLTESGNRLGGTTGGTTGGIAGGTTGGIAGVIVSNDHGKDTFRLTAVSFKNGDGITTTAAPATMISPVTVVFSVPYMGAGGNPVPLFTSYTFFF